MGSFPHPVRNRIMLLTVITIFSAGLFFMPGSSIYQRFQTGITQAKAFYRGEGTGLYVVRLAMWQEAWKIIKAHRSPALEKTDTTTPSRQTSQKMKPPKSLKNSIPRTTIISPIWPPTASRGVGDAAGPFSVAVSDIHSGHQSRVAQ